MSDLREVFFLGYETKDSYKNLYNFNTKKIVAETRHGLYVNNMDEYARKKDELPSRGWLLVSDYFSNQLEIYNENHEAETFKMLFGEEKLELLRKFYGLSVGGKVE